MAFIPPSHHRNSFFFSSFYPHLFILKHDSTVFSLLLERGKESENLQCKTEAATGCLWYMPGPGSACVRSGDQNSNLGTCPALGSSLPLLVTGDPSTNWATLARARSSSIANLHLTNEDTRPGGMKFSDEVQCQKHWIYLNLNPGLSVPEPELTRALLCGIHDS